MDREIKFRALTINNKMVYGLLSESKGNLNQPKKGFYISNNSGSPWAFSIRPDTICQFIINEDNNDIYEKDIIQEIKYGRIIRTFIAEDIRTFIREYDMSEHDSMFVVIGNIYENPELLKDK